MQFIPDKFWNRCGKYRNQKQIMQSIIQNNSIYNIYFDEVIHELIIGKLGEAIMKKNIKYLSR